MSARLQQGFTVVEVLVTLIIAAVFLLAGYQAYSLVLDESSETRSEAVASNFGYEMLRKRQAATSSPCSAGTSSISIPSTLSLPAPVTASAVTSCPFGSASATSLVTVTVHYGAPAQKVSHAIYTK